MTSSDFQIKNLRRMFYLGITQSLYFVKDMTIKKSEENIMYIYIFIYAFDNRVCVSSVNF